MNIKKLVLLCFFSLVVITSLTAEEKSKLIGKWKGNDFTLEITSNSITYKDKKHKKSEVEWSYEVDSETGTSGLLNVIKENKCTIENKEESITPELYNHLYKNNVFIVWEVKDNKLDLYTNGGTLTLEKDTSMSKTEKLLLGAAGVAAVAGVVYGAYKADQAYFSESELTSITNSAVEDTRAYSY